MPEAVKVVQTGFLFAERRQVFSLPFPSAVLMFGQPVHVAFNEHRQMRIMPLPFSGSEPYFIRHTERWANQQPGLSPTPALLVTLEATPPWPLSEATAALEQVLQPDLQALTQQEAISVTGTPLPPELLVEIVRSQLYFACVMLARDIPQGQEGRTDKLRASRLSALKLVAQRLELCARLAGEPAEQVLAGHQQSLVFYLLLTCFDRLGQTADRMTYDQWLMSSRARVEREAALAALPEQVGPLEAARLLHDAYTQHYGVRTSFDRFLDEVLPPQELRALLDSIWLDKQRYAGGQESATDTEKRKYLYELRNAYTHRAEWRYGVTRKPPMPAEVWEHITQTVALERPGTDPASRIVDFYEQEHLATYRRSVAFIGWPDRLFSAVRSAMIGVVAAALREQEQLLAGLLGPLPEPPATEGEA